MWKGILSTRKLIVNNFYFKIGDDCTINIWEDPLAPKLPNFISSVKEGVDVLS